MHSNRPPLKRQRSWKLLAITIPLICLLAIGSIWALKRYNYGPDMFNTKRIPNQSTPLAENQSEVGQPASTTALPSPAEILSSAFTELSASIPGSIGIALAPVANGAQVVSLGQLQVGPAWSTSKVPLVIAAMRDGKSPQITSPMELAITHSDNQSAEKVWSSLGAPEEAAAKVGDVLHEAGDPTIVESRRIRPEFTAFGQTIWSLSNQARFLAGTACDPRSSQVLDLMAQIESDQSWGIGQLRNSRFKGGWGPSPSGFYMVRQIGLVSAPGGTVAVAIAAEPNSGSFDDGIQALNTMAVWVSDHLSELPAGKCS
jgi:hypothetical protein